MPYHQPGIALCRVFLIYFYFFKITSLLPLHRCPSSHPRNCLGYGHNHEIQLRQLFDCCLQIVRNGPLSSHLIRPFFILGQQRFPYSIYYLPLAIFLVFNGKASYIFIPLIKKNRSMVAFLVLVVKSLIEMVIG